MVAIPWLRMAWKKYFTGEWTSYGDLKKKDEKLEDAINRNRQDINNLLNEVRRMDEIQKVREGKEAMEEILITKIEGRLDVHDEKFRDVKEMFEKIDRHQDDIFKLIGNLKDRLIK